MPRLDDLLGTISIASAALLFAVALQQPLEEVELTAQARVATPVTTAAASPTVAGETFVESQPSDRSPTALDQRT
jgi:hypothetical protein